MKEISRIAKKSQIFTIEEFIKFTKTDDKFSAYTNVLFVGDPHFKSKNELYCKKLMKNVLELCDYVDGFVCLGDILHNHSKIDESAQSLACKLLIRASKIVPTGLTLGNHDRPNNLDFLSEKQPFSWFSELRDELSLNLVIANKPEILKVKDVNIALVPFVRVGKFNEALKLLDIKSVNVIACHQEFRGCVYKNGEKSEKGDDFISKVPVISGHIHKRQMFGNILYTGTPAQHKFLEVEGKYDPKTVSVFSFENSKIKKEYRILMGFGAKIAIVVKYDEFKNQKDHSCWEKKAVDILQEQPQELKIKLTCTRAESRSFRKTNSYKTCINLGIIVSPYIIEKEQKIQKKWKGYIEEIKEKLPQPLVNKFEKCI